MSRPCGGHHQVRAAQIRADQRPWPFLIGLLLFEPECWRSKQPSCGRPSSLQLGFEASVGSARRHWTATSSRSQRAASAFAAAASNPTGPLEITCCRESTLAHDTLAHCWWQPNGRAQQRGGGEPLLSRLVAGIRKLARRSANRPRPMGPPLISGQLEGPACCSGKLWLAGPADGVWRENVYLERGATEPDRAINGRPQSGGRPSGGGHVSRAKEALCAQFKLALVGISG